MDPRTGEIYAIKSQDHLNKLEKEFGKLVPLTDEQVKTLEPLSNRRRKALLRGMSCPCASGKSFKKCCFKKYKKHRGERRGECQAEIYPKTNL